MKIYLFIGLLELLFFNNYFVVINWDTSWILSRSDVVKSSSTSICWACSSRAVLVEVLGTIRDDSCWSSLWHSSSKSVNKRWKIPSVIWRPGGQTYDIWNNCSLSQVFELMEYWSVSPMTLQCSLALFRFPPSAKNSLYLCDKLSNVLIVTSCHDALETINWSEVMVHQRQQWLLYIDYYNY